MPEIQPIYIFGAAHSGTTLLQNIFIRHGNVYSSVGETYYFEFPYIYEKDYPNTGNDNDLRGLIQFCANLVIKGYWRLYMTKTETIENDLLSEKELDTIVHTLSEHPSYAEVFHKVLDYLAEQDDKQFWVEKTPGHTFHASSILDQLPRAKAVVIVRDPRDILASLQTRQQNLRNKIASGTATEADLSVRTFVVYDPFWTCLSWRSANKAIEKAEMNHPGAILKVRYEDLVADPEATVREICRFTGLDFRDSMMNVDQKNTSFMNLNQKKESTGVVSDSVERWRKVLKTGDWALATRLLHKELKKYNYPVDEMGANERVLSVFSLIKSVPNLMNRMWSKLRYKGLAFTIATGKDYLQRFLLK